MIVRAVNRWLLRMGLVLVNAAHHDALCSELRRWRHGYPGNAPDNSSFGRESSIAFGREARLPEPPPRPVNDQRPDGFGPLPKTTEAR